MAVNAAAALAVAGTVGVDLASALDALGRARLSAMRMEVLEGPGGSTVINDAYNANPTSMRAALDALAAARGRRRVAVLGLMAELDDPAPAHAAIAEHARGLGIEVVATGTAAYGIEPTDDPLGALGALGVGDVVLVKASRAAGLERIVDALVRRDATR
jgi:UDP-N-acetylmuramoyl-tripeptide--D-alanyl-D-alanine ligase